VRLVRHLVERGWEVTVLSGTVGTYSSGCQIDPDLLARVPKTVRVVRAPVFRPFDWTSEVFNRNRSRQPANDPSSPSSDGQGTNATSARRPSWLRRAKRQLDGLTRIPDSHAGWLVPAVSRGVAAAIRHRPDILYSSSPPWTGQLVARVLASMPGCPWVADFRDPWARAPWREGRLNVARRAAELFERSVVRKADAIVFTTRTNLEEYADYYGADVASKFYLVRNGSDPDEFEGVAPLPPDDRFTLLHAGSLYGGRTPAVLFGAIAALRDRGVIDAESFRFRQIGRVSLGGFDLAAERARFRLEGLVELVPSRPRRDILREMVSASCLLLLQPGTTVSVPGKLFEYVAAGRPILAVAEEGETSDLVRASGRGLAVRPDDQAAIERAIEMLVHNRASTDGAPTVELFDGEVRTRELVGVLESVSNARLAACRPSAESSPEV
jgi:glycosyltransferase involved in cell wall biosynthesis